MIGLGGRAARVMQPSHVPYIMTAHRKRIIDCISHLPQLTSEGHKITFSLNLILIFVSLGVENKEGDLHGEKDDLRKIRYQSNLIKVVFSLLCLPHRADTRFVFATISHLISFSFFVTGLQACLLICLYLLHFYSGHLI